MKVLGIDFDANKACFVLVTKSGEDISAGLRERIQLAETRSRAAMAEFRDNVRRIIAEADPDKLSIRSKPENGQMRAGAAALKMEAVILAESPCEVDFVSSVKVGKQADQDGLFSYLQPAYKAACVSLAKAA